jgi:hypothetical protein
VQWWTSLLTAPTGALIFTAGAERLLRGESPLGIGSVGVMWLIVLLLIECWARSNDKEGRSVFETLRSELRACH